MPTATGRLHRYRDYDGPHRPSQPRRRHEPVEPPRRMPSLQRITRRWLISFFEAGDSKTPVPRPFDPVGNHGFDLRGVPPRFSGEYARASSEVLPGVSAFRTAGEGSGPCARPGRAERVHRVRGPVSAAAESQSMRRMPSPATSRAGVCVVRARVPGGEARSVLLGALPPSHTRAAQARAARA